MSFEKILVLVLGSLLTCFTYAMQQPAPTGLSLRDWLTDTQAKRAVNPDISPAKLLQQRRPTPQHVNLSGLNLINLDGISELGNLDAIESLEITNNKLNTFSPVLINQLTRLKDLDLTGNQFADLQAGAFNLPQLETLNLYVNRLITLKPGYFQGLPNLKRLGLSGNYITAIQPGTFDTLKSLEVLQLDNNRLPSFDPALVRNLPRLRVLNLKSTQGFIRNDGTVEYTNPFPNKEALKDQLQKALPGVEVII